MKVEINSVGEFLGLMGAAVAFGGLAVMFGYAMGHPDTKAMQEAAIAAKDPCYVREGSPPGGTPSGCTETPWGPGTDLKEKPNPYSTTAIERQPTTDKANAPDATTGPEPKKQP